MRNCFAKSFAFLVGGEGKFFGLGGGFRAVQAFQENLVVKCRFRAGWTQKTAAKSRCSPSFLFSVCACDWGSVFLFFG